MKRVILAICLLASACATTQHRVGTGFVPPAGGGGSGLTPIASHTFLCNNTGGAANPVACNTTTDAVTIGFQNPAAVAITGGTIALGGGTYEGVAAAIVPGVDLMWDWEYQAANFLKSKNASLTACKAVPVGFNGNGQAASASAGAFGDGQHEGGSVSSPVSTVKQWSAVLTVLPKSGNWAFEYRGSNAIPTSSGHTTFVGLSNYGGVHDMFIGGLNGTSATHYTLGIDAAAAHYIDTGTTIDGNVHNVAVVSNGTTITPYIDGTAATTLATSNFASDEGMYFYTYTNVVADLGVDRVVFCYAAR